jgi:CheY-like chemotaxis protein
MAGDLGKPQSEGHNSVMGREFPAVYPVEASGSRLSPIVRLPHLEDGSDDVPRSAESEVPACSRSELLFATLGNLDVAWQRLRMGHELSELVPGVKTSLREAYRSASRLLEDVLGTYEQCSALELNQAIAEVELREWLGNAPVSLCPYQAALEVRIQRAWLGWGLRHLAHMALSALGSNCAEARVDSGLVGAKETCTKSLFEPMFELESKSVGPQAWIQITVAAEGWRTEVDEGVLRELVPSDPIDIGGQVALGVATFCRGGIWIGGTVGRAVGARLILPLVSGRALVGEHMAPDSSVESTSQIMPRAPRAIPMQGAVLVVDDEPLILKTSVDMLRRCGVRTLTAKDGLEALKVFESRIDEIECILLDMSMPRMDGLSTLDGLRRIRANVKVILCSGHSEHVVADELGEREPVGFLQKPYRLEHLRRVLMTIIAEEPTVPSAG